jgi:hypothetical protein
MNHWTARNNPRVAIHAGAIRRPSFDTLSFPTNVTIAAGAPTVCDGTAPFAMALVVLVLSAAKPTLGGENRYTE